ncbi:uncharacterized protein LOC123546410 [Mercenaria mercenaria]|uniref:uncharacterized protein LOC123546410 n=1 Tax=Mercenaria mercenaria TaxID=6596 RepID=UPI00234EE258|nr:uncharacterized protein LOC123546410 [Mercenaria mercenaria]
MMPILTNDVFMTSIRSQPQYADRITTVRTMKLTVLCAIIYILFYNLISHRVYESLIVTPPISSIRNLYLKLDNNSFNKTRQDKTNEEHPNLENVKSVISLKNKKPPRKPSHVEEATWVEDNKQQIKEHCIKIKHQRVYIYSAIVHQTDLADFSNTKGLKPKNLIALNGWKHASSDQNLRCCYMHEDYKTISSADTLGKTVHYDKVDLKDVQYRCPRTMDSSKRIIGVTLTRYNASCPTHKNHYIRPVVIDKKKKLKIGVCTKISYGTIKAGPLVEWFEAMRFLGVDKIISYNSNLSPETQKIFDYYSAIGFLENHPFEFPEKDKYPREIGEKSFQAWADEQIVVGDCRLRLEAFKYAVFLDKDEILLPKLPIMENALRTYFDMLDDDIVGQNYFSEIHLTDWQPSNPTHPLFIGKYTVKSAPVENSVKYMFKPPFFLTGGCKAHKCLMLNGTRYYYLFYFSMGHLIIFNVFNSSIARLFKK